MNKVYMFDINFNVSFNVKRQISVLNIYRVHISCFWFCELPEWWKRVISLPGLKNVDKIGCSNYRGITYF